MTDTSKILVTGGSGFIGARVGDELTGRGHVVMRLGRSEPATRRWSLGEQPGAGAFEGASALIHCAYDMTLSKWDDIRRTNIEGTDKLLAAAAESGVKRIVLISSIAAFEGCQSDYGRAKLACETIATRHNAVVLRPGMVWGDNSGGVYAAMEQWVQSLPVTPVLVPSPSFYMCHVQDLAELIAEIVDLPAWEPDRVTTAFPRPLRFDEVVMELQRRHGKRKPLLPIPWRAPWLACKTLEAIGVRPPFRSDGLVGLMKANPRPDFSALDRYQTRFRSFIEQQGAGSR